MEILDRVFINCRASGVDEGILAFAALDREGASQRGTSAGGEIWRSLGGQVLLRHVLPLHDVTNTPENISRLCKALRMPAGGLCMRTCMQRTLDSLPSARPPKRAEEFMQEIVGTHAVASGFRMHETMSKLRTQICASAQQKQRSLRDVQFPTMFHVQWTAQNPKMRFHASFQPWKMAVALARVLCSPFPPCQVRENPYKDPAVAASSCQAPRKYVVDWDLPMQKMLGKCVPKAQLTEDFLFGMFVRMLGVVHAYMRELGVLPVDEPLSVSIKSRTRRMQHPDPDTGECDTKCSFHGTLHVMAPAATHKVVMEAVIELVRKRAPLAHDVMTKLATLQSPGELKSMGDCAGFIGFDAAMLRNPHQAVQIIGSCKDQDSVRFKHRAVVQFACRRKEKSGNLGKPHSPQGWDCTVTLAQTEQERYPDKSVLDMATLIADHAATIPTTRCIPYAHQSCWDKTKLSSFLSSQGADFPATSAAECVMASIVGGTVGVKKGAAGKRLGTNTTSSSSGEISAKSKEGRAPPAHVGQYLHIMASFVSERVMMMPSEQKGGDALQGAGDKRSSALGSSALGSSTLEMQPVQGFKTHPTACRSDQAHAVFAVRRVPCIVHLAESLDLVVHKSNRQYVYVEVDEKRPAADIMHGVWMKCMDPDCAMRVRQNTLREGGDAKAAGSKKRSRCKAEAVGLDQRGWGHVKTAWEAFVAAQNQGRGGRC